MSIVMRRAHCRMKAVDTFTGIQTGDLLVTISAKSQYVLAVAVLLLVSLNRCGGGRVRVWHPSPGETEEGIASFYDGEFVGRRTANGEIMDRNALTAAHKSLAFGTVVRVQNRENGLEAVVKINDRGPFIRGRIIDLTLAGARAIGIERAGTARVRIEVLSAPPAGAPYYVQVGAFAERSNAERLRERLGEFEVMLASEDGLTKVRVGPVAGEREARLLAGRLRKLDLPAIIVVGE